MSRLHPSLLALDKGLNLQTAKILAPEGSVLDSLNYEQVDFQGQKRIDGYTRYDGSVLASFDDFVVVPNTDWQSGDGNFLGYNLDGELFGRALAAFDVSSTSFAVINENTLPDSYVAGIDAVANVQQHYDLVLSYQDIIRSTVENLPGAVIGLHWFRDRLYAVADLIAIELEGDVAALPNDTFIYNPGDIDVPGVILDVFDFLDNTIILVASPVDGTDIITIPRLSTNATIVSRRAGIAASFFESRTEQQVLEEDGPSGPYDFGWRFKHLGWEVPFIEGSSLFGSLTALNLNRQGVGVEGPTSISGDNGKPLVLTQKVSITNLPTQVNGWKTSTSPTVYNLEAEALDEVDDYTIYADAYFSWDGVTGVISSPGITGDELTEYPANNTVVVDV